jgi:hypothetical protein
MIGPTIPNATLMMNCTATMLHRETRQRGGSRSRESLTAGGAVSFIRISIGARNGRVKKSPCGPRLSSHAVCAGKRRNRVTEPLCLTRSGAL